MDPLLHKTPPLVRSLPQAGRLWVSPTRFSGRCTSSSLLPSWRSLYSLGSLLKHLFIGVLSAAGERHLLLSPPLLRAQVQRCVQVPAERAAGAVAAAALLGSTDAEETPQVQPDRCCEVEATQPHGLPDRQPAVLLAGNDTVKEAPGPDVYMMCTYK